MMKIHKMMFLISLIMGTCISVSSYSWMGMWMGLEINLLSMIPLMNKVKNSFSSESSIKYFITQALASTIILFAVITIMNSELMNTVKVKSTLITIMNSSLMTKMGTAPFHFWFPEIIEGLDWINCLILLTWQKIAPMVILMSNLKSLLFITAIIVTSMLIGGLMSMNQISLRKILVFSSINHMGWMLAAMLTSKPIWLNYFTIYSLILMAMISILNHLKIFFFKQMISQMSSQKLLKLSMSINFLSLGGLPPLIGFYPKWLTINALVEKGLLTLVMVMVLMTLVTLFVYARIVFSSIVISSDQLSFKMKSMPMKMSMVIFNSINILGLTLTTLTFNFV